VAGHVILQHRTGVWTLEVEAPSRFADGDRNCDSDGNLNLRGTVTARCVQERAEMKGRSGRSAKHGGYARRDRLDVLERGFGCVVRCDD
jgi:hypothetical protein